MAEVIFYDAIGDIRFEHGVFRIDFVSISPTKRDKENKPVLEHRQQVIMPPDGFLRSFATMERVVKRLVETGVIKQTSSQKDEEATNSNEAPPSFS